MPASSPRGEGLKCGTARRVTGIVQNPQIISEMKPSELLNQSPQNPAQTRPAPPQTPQPRFENQNQATPNANRPAVGSGTTNRPAAANANR